MNTLIIVDLQNDFLSFGMQPVEGILEEVKKINEMIPQFNKIVAAKLWFPTNHQRFAANHPWRHPGGEVEIEGEKQSLFEYYCIQNTFGAALISSLQREKIEKLFQRGSNSNSDIDNLFFDKKNHSTGLLEYLEESQITRITLAGVNHLQTFEKTIAIAEKYNLKCDILK